MWVLIGVLAYHAPSPAYMLGAASLPVSTRQFKIEHKTGKTQWVPIPRKNNYTSKIAPNVFIIIIIDLERETKKERKKKNGIIHQGLDEKHSNGAGKGIFSYMIRILLHSIFTLNLQQGEVCFPSLRYLCIQALTVCLNRSNLDAKSKMVLIFLEKSCV